jgi:hypothetical protein
VNPASTKITVERHADDTPLPRTTVTSTKITV